MARKPTGEQRQHPRIPSKLPIISAEDSHEPFEMESVNLSLGGVYCTTRRQVPLMTRLQVILHLPSGNGIHPGSADPIRAEAVVVRVTPGEGENAGKFEIALFFSRMEGEDRIKLATYLDLKQKEKTEL